MKFRAGKTVAFLGCREGLDLLLASLDVGPRGKVIGVDPAAEPIAAARRQIESRAAAQATVWPEFHQSPLESLPIPASSTDFVVCHSLATLAVDRDAAFREIARILKPGGIARFHEAMLKWDLPPSLGAELAEFFPAITRAFSKTEFRDQLKSAGLQERFITPLKINLNTHVKFENFGDYLQTNVALQGAAEAQPMPREVESDLIRLLSLLSRYNLNDYVEMVRITAQPAEQFALAKVEVRPLKAKPARANRRATTRSMLAALRALMASPPPARAKRGHWTQLLLVEELTQRGFHCSATTVAQAMTLLRRERDADSRR